MEEIIKNINDTNASYRALDAGRAKNTDLFLDSEHFELFKDAGSSIRVRFSRTNLTQSILFIASILPRKYGCSAIHKVVDFSLDFINEQLTFLERMFAKSNDGYYIQEWHIRKDVVKQNGELDPRFYFIGLFSEFEYTDATGNIQKGKFTVRNYLAGGYSKLHIKRGSGGVFDVWIENSLVPVRSNKFEEQEVPDITSRQKVFFGTPGSGKSHRVKELTEGKRVHRTTFHPDSDYASFVGCYKPTMQSSIEDNLSLEELIQRIPEIQNEDNAIGKFTIKYYRSIQKLQETPDKQDLRRRIQEAKGANSDGASQYAYMNQAISLGIYLDKEGLWRDNSTISYSFIPQVFTEAYVEAWKKHTDASLEDKDVYLVIEEINRGNCAQIFGDLFQLLDRNNDGYSDYRIKADSDLRSYLTEKLGENHEGIQNGELCLPPNLHILATMNTSDQSLFPMDSAFKRRWDWEYVPVNYSEEIESGKFTITIGDKKYLWVNFLRRVNEEILKVTDSEDKQMGNFFIKSDVGEDEFKSKVMFYLWNEVCKDEYRTPNNFFRISQDSEFSFNDLYQTDRLAKLQGFMAYLGVEPITENTDQVVEEPIEA